jgi:putative transposase
VGEQLVLFADRMREGLLAASVAIGLETMGEFMEAEVTEVVGPKGKHNTAGRVAYRHGAEAGAVTLGGRRVEVRRPRVRGVDDTEIHLESYDTFASIDLLTEHTVAAMLAGVSTRRYNTALEPVGAEVEATAASTSRSSVSRRFKTATQAGLDELMSRDLSELKLAVLMLDGVHFAEACCVVALAICVDGTKVPVGLWLGDTENKTIVTALLADLVDRGLAADDGLLVVIDGAKALAAAVRKVFGSAALIQRCTLHKRRNVRDHLPKDQRAWVDRKLAASFANENTTNGERAARDLARQLEARWPDAAASLREGLEEMFTVRRLGITGRLAATLTNTNCIESMISVARDTTRNVKRWRDGKMIKRWCAAGMLNAERSFRRLKGHKQMPALVAALARHVETVTPSCDTAKVA